MFARQGATDGVRVTDVADVADVAWVSHRRLAGSTTLRFVRPPPGLCVEIMSPSDTRADRHRRAAPYQVAGPLKWGSKRWKARGA